MVKKWFEGLVPNIYLSLTYINAEEWEFLVLDNMNKKLVLHMLFTTIQPPEVPLYTVSLGSEMLPSFTLTAYLQTGKDTFIQELQQHKLVLCPTPETESKVRWIVYARTKSTFPALPLLFNTAVEKRRFAFADALKVHTHARLGLKDCPPHVFENVKDVALFRESGHSEFQSMRSFYKQFAQEARAKDPLTWAKIVYAQVAEERKAMDFIDVISDWRFPNELNQKDMRYTIRLHRKDVPVPAFASDGEEESEHALDHFETNFLLLPPGKNEFDVAIARFPQYASFIAMSYICT